MTLGKGNKFFVLLTFATALAVSTTVAAMGNNSPSTTGNYPSIKVIGTIVGHNATACAIIQDNRSGVQRICYLGDIIHGALLQDIQRGKVVLILKGDQKQIFSAENSIKEIIAQQVKDPVGRSPRPFIISDHPSTLPTEPLNKFYFKKL